MLKTQTCLSINHGAEPHRRRPGRNLHTRYPQPFDGGSPHLLVFTSSSRFLCRVFPHYTRAIRRLFIPIKFLDRLSIIALFLSVLLAYVLTFVPPPDSGVYDSNISNPVHDAVPDSFRAKVPMWSPTSQNINPMDPAIITLQSHKRLYQKRKGRQTIPALSGTVGNSLATPEVPGATTMTGIPSISYQFERELLKTQTNLHTLPQTSWYYNKQLESFRPPGFRTNGIRLVTLNNACYCTYRNKFILPYSRTQGKKNTKVGSGHRFPSFLFRYGAAQSASWKSVQHILAFSNQKAVFVSGTTVLWRGRALDAKEQYLHRALIPIRSVLDIIRQSTARSELHVAAEKFGMASNSNPNIAKLLDYYLGVPTNLKRISLAQLRPHLVCFHRVMALGSEYDNHAASTEVYDHVKKLVEEAEHGKLRAPLVKACAYPDANTRNIWIIHRQAARASFEFIENLSQVETIINHELIRLHLAEKVSLRVVQAPNTPCPPGTAREGCYDLFCNEIGTASRGCLRFANPLREAQIYNNMTFIITTSGLITESFPYLPRGSHIIEVVPYGFLDPTYERAAQDAHVVYHRVRGKLSKSVQLEFFQRFGDVAATVDSCWADPDCRTARINTQTFVDMHQLRTVLKKALFTWRTACARESLHEKK